MRLLTLDFETYYSSDYSLSRLTTEEYIRHPDFWVHGAAVAIDDEPFRWIPGLDIKAYLSGVDPSQTALLCHNTQFDGAILAWHYDWVPAIYLDTLCMARVGLPGRPPAPAVSLAALARQYGLPPKGDDLPLSKGLKHLPSHIEARIAEYARHDGYLTRELWRILSRGFPKDELKLIDLTVRLFTQPRFVIDAPVLWESLDRIQEHKASLLARCGLTREDLQSAARFAAVLESLGVSVQYKDGKKGPIPALAKTDPFMQSLLEDEDPDIQALAAARLGIKSTIDETRTQRFLSVASRGSLPVQLKYYAAHPGRWGGDGKLNFQNLRRKSPLRECLLAPEGHVVVVADSAQIEARLLAWAAGHMELLEAFRSGDDIYKEMASSIYGKRLEAVTPDERFVGKTTILGCGYGMGAVKFREQLRRFGRSIAEEEAERAVRAYRHRHAPIPALWREMESRLPDIARNGLTLPNGTVLHYQHLTQNTDGWSYQGRRERVSLWGGSLTENYIQALARIIVAEQMLTIAERYPVVLMVHDEVVAIVPEDEGGEALEFMIDVMRTAPSWCADLPLNAEGGWARNYSK